MGFCNFVTLCKGHNHESRRAWCSQLFEDLFQRFYREYPERCANMDNPNRHEEIPLYKSYTEVDYPTYDNLDAIEVDKAGEIPADYFGLIGVPDSFMDRFNPDQFELVGIPFGNLGKEIGVTKNYRGRTDVAITDSDGRSRCPYSRIIIRRKPT